MKPERWKKIEKLFNAALELEPGRRTEFLAEACKGDEALRAEVESLLEHGDQPGSFIESPAMKRIARDIASKSESDSIPLPLIGRTVSHYHIVDKVGVGGMGVVYRARDRKLGRDVAIKVLPEAFARDPERIARFQREAKVLASLNHSNIAAIYDLLEIESEQFLVQELIDGETLADRMKQGPIPIEESLELALQITDALEAAHEKDIIHRDLKPANIKVTPEGKVKVLDFGLARVFRNKIHHGDASLLSETGETITEAGVVLGTATYMSPEQVKGKLIDERADIWAFGCVLFEMLAGQSPFAGEDFSQTLANVLEREPDFSLLPRNMHPKIKETLERCLEKDIKKRWRHIADVRLDIRKVLDDKSGGLVKPGITEDPRNRLRKVLPVIAAALVCIILVAGFLVWDFSSVSRQGIHPTIHFVHELPDDQYFTNTDRTLMDLSPDGTKMVYIANRQLYLRDFSELTAIPVPGTEGIPVTPFFSHDGKWIGYFSAIDRKLKKVAISGGAPVALCDAAYTFGATWEEKDSILFGQGGSVMRVAASGGTAEIVIEAEQGEQIHGPRILPGGEWVLFTVTDFGGSDRWDRAQVVAQSLESGERKVLLSGGSDARYVPTGHLVYASGSDLFAIAFDPEALEVNGVAVRIVQGVQRATVPGMNTGAANYSFSDGGMLAYVEGGTSTSPLKLVWVDRKGNEAPLEVPPKPYFDPRISPDGTKVAFTDRGSGNSDIWIWDLIRKNIFRLTFDEAEDAFPTWTLDNQRIIFCSNRRNIDGIFWKKIDGTGKSELLFSDPDGGLYSSSLSGDGETIAIVKYSNKGFDIVAGSINGEHALNPILHEDSNEFHTRISPDGKWIAYVSDESGKYEVYVHPFPDVTRGKWQISTNGGDSPIWSRDSRELFYRNGSDAMRVEIKTDPVFRALIPETLFKGTYLSESAIQWDISPDGKRFLMIKPAPDTNTRYAAYALRKIIVVTNWFEELKKKAPVP